MALEIKTGQTIRVTINKPVTRAGAAKTLERLFCKDKAITGPLAERSKNFKAIPKRRGGRIWTKYPNKLHPKIDRGVVATLVVTPQVVKDLNSVATFIDVAQA